MSFFKSYLYL